jgi:enterochelin esterase-like enzyme
MAIACPYTPNPWKAPNPSTFLDAYTSWIVDEMIPRCQIEAPVVPDPAKTGLDGCSLGGYVGIELFLRRPEVFGAWGGVQSALREAAAATYAERLRTTIDRVGARKLHVETSGGDPFRAANELFFRELGRRKVPVDFRIAPGPHDQPWLRETGTLEMLLWHDRALG